MPSPFASLSLSRIWARLHKLAAPRLGWFLLSVLLLGGCAATPLDTRGTTVTAPATHAETPPVSRPSLHIAAVGDIMLGTDYPQDRLPPGGPAALLAGVAPVLRQADITFGNLEGVLMDGGEPAKHCKDPRFCYLFRSPTAYAEVLRDAGFSVLSLANNHARDFGEEGRESSMQALTRAGIHHSGKEGDIAEWTVKGVKVALIAFAPFIGANDMLDDAKVAASVAALKRTHDVVIVSFHGGAEGAGAMRLPFAPEEYHGELRGDVVHFAHLAVDAGADLVVGHGPHVARAVEVYRDRLIAYSLGNFCTYRGINIAGVKGLAPILLVKVAADGRFLGGHIVSARQSREHGTRLDPGAGVQHLIDSLTRADFPLHGPRIAADGALLPSVGLAQHPTPAAEPVGIPPAGTPAPMAMPASMTVRAPAGGANVTGLR